MGHFLGHFRVPFGALFGARWGHVWDDFGSVVGGSQTSFHWGLSGGVNAHFFRHVLLNINSTVGAWVQTTCIRSQGASLLTSTCKANDLR